MLTVTRLEDQRRALRPRQGSYLFTGIGNAGFLGYRRHGYLLIDLDARESPEGSQNSKKQAQDNLRLQQ